jgi:FAD/FMN-containing dehydrogenase
MTEMAVARESDLSASISSADAPLQQLRSIVGAGNVFSGAEIEERYCSDMMRKYSSSPLCVVRPSSTEEVADIVRLARAANLAITTLGGRTGVVGGGMCLNGEIALSLERMNKILELDADSMTMTVEAGVILQRAQEEAETHELLLPLDLGARGSATIGGAIATNAGGVRVLRWGTMRDMVLGLEAVLADGSIVTSLTKSLKDNAGYHWRDLFLGSEGTLGIVTRAVLRLRPLPKSAQTALLALDDFSCVPRLLRLLDASFAGQLSSFELMWADFYEFVSTAQLPQRRRPLPLGSALYVLIETLGADSERDMDLFQRGLTEALDRGLAGDVVIAQTERERANLWAVRDDLTEAYKPLFPLAAFDVSVSLKDMPSLVERARNAVQQIYPSAKMLFYGHAGDGNLHAVIKLDPNDASAEAKVERAVYECVREYGGSISAEHGIGLAKREYLSYTRSPAEVALMRTIKSALDPDNLMNPGKVLPDSPTH